MNTITFPINNGLVLKLSQDTHGGPVSLSGPYGQSIIPAGDMVQLCNLYRYVKRADISDDFINPRGRCWQFSGDGLRPVPDPVPEEQPLQYWFFLYQDGDAGIHILRRALSVDDDSAAAQLDIIERYRDKGGALLAAWPACQVVELADIDGPGLIPGQDPSESSAAPGQASP